MKVYSVGYESQADVKVFVVDYESQADLNVYKVSYESHAGKNDGKWFFVSYENHAQKKIFFVNYESQIKGLKENQKHVETLKKQLDEAVKNQEFEKAAQLRDQIKNCVK